MAAPRGLPPAARGGGVSARAYAGRGERVAPARAADAPPTRGTRVLTFMDYYLPGFRAGGPIPAVANLVEALAPDVRFSVVTRDHDLGVDAPYPQARRGAWAQAGSARVRYASRWGLGALPLMRLVRTEPHEVVYLNSFFSRISIRLLVLRWLGLVPRAGLVVAPRGEFAAAALRTRRWRKRAWMAVSARLGVCRDVVWQASSAHEAEEIRAFWDADVPTFLTPELPSALGPAVARSPKRRGEVRLVSVARISRIKNIDGALRMLAGVRTPVALEVYGPIEDAAYAEECRAAAAALPAHVRVRFHGELPRERLPEVLADAHAFYLPTLRENYGHAIIEAMSAGCPVLISDRTPWRALEARGVGWDLPVDDAGAFRAAVERLAAMPAEEHARFSAAAAAYAREVAADPGPLEQHRALFRAARGAAPGGGAGDPVPVPVLARRSGPCAS
ncbi:MAG: glycosyltransferase family 4 protein [Gemmatimonadetes bacterium]|nr:glycosyltransferase family 4 protein [Gemmatimonadota bacterium]